MSGANKILYIFLALWVSSIAPLTVLAQSTIKKTGKKGEKSITLGIQTGKELLLKTPGILGPTKIQSSTTKSFVVRKTLNHRFAIETGLTYATNSGMDCFSSKKAANETLSKLSLPISFQYYFFPEKYKLHPYCGAGIQGSLSNNNNQLRVNNDDGYSDYNKRQSDTKNITILFTQGFTFEVNTKIQVNESLHFIPGNTKKVIGIDFGVGYKFP